MNYPIIFFGIVCWLGLTVGCQEKEALYSAHPEIDPYVKLFQEEAKLRGKSIDLYEEGLVVELGILPKGKAGKCSPNDFPKEIIIDSTLWEKLDMQQREVLVFHELGHCLLNRGHNNNKLPYGECASIMDGNDEEGNFICSNNYYSDQWRRYYLDELFDSETSLPDWYQIPDISNLKEKLKFRQRIQDTCFICTPLRNFYRVFDTVKLQEQVNFLITMTYQKKVFEEAFKMAWNDLLFRYSPSKNHVEIEKIDLSEFDNKQSYLFQYAKYPNNSFYSRNNLPELNYPITLDILKKNTMLYFYLNKHPMHAMEYTTEKADAAFNVGQNKVVSSTSQEPNTSELIVYTF